MKVTSFFNKARISSKLFLGSFFSLIYEPSTKVVILHQGRVGSTFFQDLLISSYGNTLNHLGEIYSFSRIPVFDDGTFFLDSLFSSRVGADIAVIELKYGIDNHLSLLGFHGMQSLFNKNYKFLLLSRKDKYKQAQSLLYAQYADTYHYTSTSIPTSNYCVRLTSPFFFSGNLFTSVQDLADYIVHNESLMIDFLLANNIDYDILFYEELVSMSSNYFLDFLPNYFPVVRNGFTHSRSSLIKSPLRYDELLFVED